MGALAGVLLVAACGQGAASSPTTAADVASPSSTQPPSSTLPPSVDLGAGRLSPESAPADATLLPPMRAMAGIWPFGADQTFSSPSGVSVPDLDVALIIAAAETARRPYVTPTALLYGTWLDARAKSGLGPYQVEVVDVIAEGSCPDGRVRSDDPAVTPPAMWCEQHILVDPVTMTVVAAPEIGRPVVGPTPTTIGSRAEQNTSRLVAPMAVDPDSMSIRVEGRLGMLQPLLAHAAAPPRLAGRPRVNRDGAAGGRGR